ncbi:MAG: iron-sulfur cluster assembly scaffold protein [Rhodothalassiaceae bacterium]
MDEDALYSRAILRWTAALPETRRLPNPTVSVTRTSRICGSRLRLDLALDTEGRIADVGHEVKACAIGQASCAVFLRHLPGRTLAELQPLAEAFNRMITEGSRADGPAALPAPWQDLVPFAAVHPFRARHGAACLPSEAILSALKHLEKDTHPAAAQA